MNKRIEHTEVQLHQTYWYNVYQGDSKPDARTLVQVIGVGGGETSLMNVYTNVVFKASPYYSHFEEVNLDWVKNSIKAKRDQITALAAEIEALGRIVTSS